MEYDLRLLFLFILIVSLSVFMQLEVRVPEQVIILESNPTIQDTALMAITASNNANLQTLLSLAMTSNKELQEEIIRR